MLLKVVERLKFSNFFFKANNLEEAKTTYRFVQEDFKIWKKTSKKTKIKEKSKCPRSHSLIATLKTWTRSRTL